MTAPTIRSRRRSRRALAALLPLALVALASRNAIAQQPPDDDTATQAKEHYEKGQAAYDGGRYDEAIVEWQQSYELSGEPLLLFNLGQAARKKGDCEQALGFYQDYLRASPEAGNRAEAEGFVSEMQTCLDKKAKAGNPVEQPKKPPVVDSLAPDEQPIVDLEPAHPGRAKKWIGMSLVGAGALAVASGLYFGARADSAAVNVSTACGGAAGCEWSEVASIEADGQRAETTQWILYGVGGAAMVGGAIFYYLGTREQSAADTRVALEPRRRGAVIMVGARW